jgi:tetratricopeptide (TPR) repeat protein
VALVGHHGDLKDWVSPPVPAGGGNTNSSSKGRARASTVLKIGDGNICSILEMVLKKGSEIDVIKVTNLLAGKTESGSEQASSDKGDQGKPGSAEDAAALNTMLKRAKSLEGKGQYVEALYAYLLHRSAYQRCAKAGEGHIMIVAETANLFGKLGAPITPITPDCEHYSAPLTHLPSPLVSLTVLTHQLTLPFSATQTLLHTLHHPILHLITTTTGVAAVRQDEIKQALTWHEKELELRQQTLSDDMDVSIAPTLQALGEVLIRLKKSDLALAHFKRALKIRQKAFVDGHPTVAATLLSIGRVHHDARREAEALVAYNKALEYREAKHGPLHPGVASIFSAIGELYLQQGKLNEALAFHQKAMKIRTIKLAHDHPDIAYTHHYLGETYTKMGRHEVRALISSYCHTVTPLLLVLVIVSTTPQCAQF